MNASQFMDKQIMDLASSTNSQTQSKDFIDLMKHPEEDHCGGRNGGGGGDEINGLRAEEIVPSYDFQPIRPISTGLSSPKSLSFDGESSARAWGSVDSKTNTNVPIRNYSSLDSFEPAKVILEKDQHADTASIVSEIDQTIKKHIDNLLHALDTVSARLTQLESRTRNLENSVDDLKVAAGNNYGSTDGKMRQLENMLREVQNGVQVIKDKQEIMEGQFQIPKLQISKPDHPQETHDAANVDSVQPPPPSLPQQSHTLQQPPPPPASAPFQQPVNSLPPTMAPPSSAPFQQSVTSLPPTMTPPPPPSQQQILPPSVPIPNKFPQLPNPSVPQREPYFPPPPGQPHEASNQQYQLPPTQQPLPPAAQQHQQYPPPQQAPYSQPTHPPQHPSQIQPPPGNHPEEPPYMHYPPPSFRQPPPSQPPPSQPPPSQPPQDGVPPSQQLYGSPAHVYEPPPVRSSLGFSSDPYPYGGSSTQYGSNSPVKPHQHSQSSSGGGYPQLPTARVLPQALPTASGINSGSGSSGTGNRLPVDDVVDKVTSMGFPRDQVRATVRKLTESGQSVDLNMVLDKLMNDSDVQPPRGWFGR